jgi:tight adherence protein C
MRFITSLSDDPIIGRWLIIALFAGSIFIIVIALYVLISNHYDPVREQLQSISGNPSKPPFFRNASQQLGNYFVSKEKPGEKPDYSRERLIQAGFHSETSISRYYGMKILLTIGLPVLIYGVCFTFYPKLDSITVLLLASSGLLLGFIGPSFYLDRIVEARKRTIRNAFANVIDELLICIEAGLGLDAALQRVSINTLLSNDVMGYELGQVTAEMTTGISREQALKNLVTRTGVEEIRGLTSALTQSMRFGSSVANTLRIYADDLRDKRMQNAEEQAAKLAVTMMLPLAFCFFPGIFIVILGPALISVYASFAHL